MEGCLVWKELLGTPEHHGHNEACGNQGNKGKSFEECRGQTPKLQNETGEGGGLREEGCGKCHRHGQRFGGISQRAEAMATRCRKQLLDNKWDEMDIGKDLDEPKETVIPTGGMEENSRTQRCSKERRIRISP